MNNLATQTENKTGGIVLPQVVDDGRFDVVFFQVNYDSNQISNDPLSPFLETREQAQAFLAEIKKTVPTAKMGKYTFDYSSIDAEGREELLNKIVKAEVSDE